MTIKIQQWKWQQWKFENENSDNENLIKKCKNENANNKKCQQWKSNNEVSTMKKLTMKMAIAVYPAKYLLSTLVKPYST